MAAHTRVKVLSLYKTILKESGKFSAYNYRMYAIRRIKDVFREHKTESNPETIASLIKKAEKNLDMIRRQVVIGQMYSTNKLVIEAQPPRT